MTTTSHDWGGRLILPPAGRGETYLASGEWSTTPTARRFSESATRHGARPAVITADEELTYAELDTRTDQIAAGLIALGLQPLDPVMFQVTNRMGAVLAWYGCLKAGAIPVATLAAHRMHEIGHISEKVGATAHVVEAGMSFDLVKFGQEVADDHPTMRLLLSIGEPADGARATRIEDLGSEIAPDAARAAVDAVQDRIDPRDVAVFQLSGGTTGVPKVIPRLHVEYWNNGLMYAQHLGWSTETRVAHLIPIIHNAGISCGLHAAHSVGACLVLSDAEPLGAFSLMTRAQANAALFGHAHYQAVMMPEFEPVLEHLRLSVLSGAKVSQQLFDRVDDGDKHWAGQMFGMSEGMFTVSAPGTSAQLRMTTVGSPIAASDELRVLEPGTETELADGEVGELCCRGPYTITGYFDAPDHNQTAFTSDGFYRTGDLASVRTSEGLRHVTIEGRIKDLINRGGEKVNAEEVELLLVKHPDIATAAVVAMPDPRLGERACAYLVAASSRTLTMEQVQEHLDGLGVAKFKWPERLEWVPQLPRTNVGKVDKKRLRNNIIELLNEKDPVS